MRDIYIFDLDGTLADIQDRRDYSRTPKGKIDWDKFFDPKNIEMDKPNEAVIQTAKDLHKIGNTIYIFSGRSAGTMDATIKWLHKHLYNSGTGRSWAKLLMRPVDKLMMPDDELKQSWLNDPEIIDKNRVIAVFDDRDKVVKMWRKNGIPCFQVAEGNF